MPNIVGVRFTRAGRVHYFDAGSMDLAVGERVLVEADGGPREAQVVIAPRQVLYSELRGPLSPVLQKAE
jgi:cell fate regulator YaaT (PSP1 superfamily)